MTRHLRSIVTGCALVALGTSARAQDTTRLALVYNALQPPGMAVMPVTGAFGDSVRAIIQRDLLNSDAFKMVTLVGNDPTTFRPANGLMNYPMMAQFGAKFVVEPKITGMGIHVVLHDVDGARVAFVKDWNMSANALGRDWRMDLHAISDSLQSVITGTPGIAATRIAYYRQNTINLIDTDGYNDVPMAVERDAYSPAWNPSGHTIIYSTIGDSSRVISVDLRNFRSTVLVPMQPNVVYSSPTYAADGLSLFYVASGESGADIYRAGADGSSPHRLTIRAGDNIDPAVKQSGNRMAFTTTRTGPKTIWVMNIDGTEAEQIQSWRDRSVDQEPDWSPDGTKLVFVSEVNGVGAFQLFVRDMVKGEVTRLTDQGVNQQPTFAPDGRHIVFSSDRTGKNQLFILDLETNTSRQLTKSAGSKMAAWSPRLVR